MSLLLWLSLAVPAAFALATRFAPRAAPDVAMAGAALAAVPSVLLLADASADRTTTTSLTWLPAADLDLGLRLDGLSAAMTMIVAGIGLVVVVYAAGYFADDPRRASALAGLLGFLAVMQGLVLADGYLTLLIFWELVGAASARLIAYTRQDAAAPGASVRAFLTTRTADLGLYAAVLALFSATGSLAFGAERPAGALGVLIGAGLVLAAMGKSAQAPLQTWLSAAMAGPTPVSALLHSATMVAAGVYLLARSYELLAGWPLELAGWIGALTAVAGAGIALAQTDLKRVLAGSTTSQLGLMFVGVAAGGPAVAVFHLFAHALGKAGLFLAAGIFQHNRGTTALDGLRGAGRDDRAAFAGFAVCALSIAAVPPFAAFWSKEHIAAAAEPTVAWFVLVLVATAGSAAYLLRPALILWRRVEREERVSLDGRAPMITALAILSVGSLLGGFAGPSLAALLAEPELPTSTLALLLSTVAVAVGVAAVGSGRRPPATVVRAFRDQLGIDRAITRLVVRPVFALAAAAFAFDRRIVDAAVDGVGRGAVDTAQVTDRVERRWVDGAVDGLARVVGRSGDDLRRVQSGRLFEYLRDAVIGVVAVCVVLAISALA